MILLDTNILIYSSIKTAPYHGRAKIWLDKKLNGDAPVGMPWQSLTGFLRIVTNARIFDPPVSPEDAWKVVNFWLDCGNVWIPEPSEKHRRILDSLYKKVNPQGNLVPDAHLAALAMEHGLILCSTDGDFARFPGLSWIDPLR